MLKSNGLARYTLVFVIVCMATVTLVASHPKTTKRPGVTKSQPARARLMGRLDPGPHRLRIELTTATQQQLEAKEPRGGATLELLIRFDLAQEQTLPTVTPATPLEREMLKRGEPLSYTVKPRVGVGVLQLRPTGATVTSVTVINARGQETLDLTKLAERRDAADSTADKMIPIPIDTRDFTPGTVGDVRVKLELGAKNQGSALDAALVFAIDRDSALPITDQEQSLGRAAIAFGVTPDNEVVLRSVARSNAAQRLRMTTDVDYLLSRRLSASTHAGKPALPLSPDHRKALKARPASTEIESLQSGAPLEVTPDEGGAR